MLAAQIQFAQKVGVAPSTTTMVLGDGDLGIQCYPIPSVTERAIWLGLQRTQSQAVAPAAPAALAAKKRSRALNPYASEVEMRGLGLVDPNDAWRTGDVARVRAHGTTTILFNPLPGGGFSSQLLGAGGLGITNGEIARSLSGLGTIPNDDELARNLCYTPVHSGWIYGNTPTGQQYYADGLYGEDPTIADVVKNQRRQMILQGVTTAAIVGMAAASLWAAFKPRGRGARKIVKRRRRR